MPGDKQMGTLVKHDEQEVCDEGEGHVRGYIE